MRIIRKSIVLFLIVLVAAGCGVAQSSTPIQTLVSIPPTLPASTAVPTALQASPAGIQPALPENPTSTPQQKFHNFDLSKYRFPKTPESNRRYLFYIHGKIIEDQGLPAISPDYGEYEYQAILEKLSSLGFVVISEQRVKNTDSYVYAQRVSEQVSTLLDSGVPANQITVVGASKGAGIALFASHLLKNKDINFVVMAICVPETIQLFKEQNMPLFGNVLSIYDSVDPYAGSCQELFTFSEGKGLSRHDEIVLKIGSGHGVFYKPLDDWVIPVMQWAENP